MQGNEDISEVSVPEGTQIGENASPGLLGAWLEQLWIWWSGNEGGGVSKTASQPSVFRPPFLTFLP